MPSGRELALILAAAVVCVGVILIPRFTRQRKWEKLNAQVEALYEQGKYAEAVPKALEALRVAEATFGSEHVNVATSQIGRASCRERVCTTV